ncbi:SigE family RNA polymerase sigma factor [Hamadaea tsunoensis]|uniref:SigE family RNA polymerase sigma factor n=1 Tax=Hamadaea tsunoensis TaxID=53368 RepID=UPI00041807C5|nr:SigE family RNA polymerase sigma factor [Hamadaea tsunoensis]
MDFTEFYQSTSPRTLRYAYGLTGDLAQAQDVVQEAYARAWQRWRQLSGYDDAEGWLRLVVARLATDWWRHLRVRRSTPLPPPAAVPGPSEDTVLVVAALKKLPGRQRQAIALHYLLDVPVAQIADELGVSEGTVKSWLSRGRDSLAVALRTELAGIGLPGPRDAEDRGRRRRRTRMVATVTAAGLAVIAVIVLAIAVVGRPRSAPLPPVVRPTGSPIAFSPLRQVGSTPLESGPVDAMSIQNGRAYTLSFLPDAVVVASLDLATAQPAWPPAHLDLPAAPGDTDVGLMTATVPEAILVARNGTLAAVDPGTGRLRWRVTVLGDKDFGSWAVFPHVLVYADRTTGELVGIDLSTGERRWHRPMSVRDVFGLLTPSDLAGGDRGIGVPDHVFGSGRAFVADGVGTLTEIDAPTGVSVSTWKIQPSGGGYIGYNGDIYIPSTRELYRLHLADGRQTRLYAGGGVISVAPCGAEDICLLDVTESNDKIVVSLHDTTERWWTSVPGATAIATAGRRLRVSLSNNSNGSQLLDENGRTVLRLNPDSTMARLDAGNLLGIRTDGTRVEVTGIATATGLPKTLGTVDMTAGGWAAAGTKLVVATADGIVVYDFG